ncbi:hypothetical protein DH2020_010765 [Rehmannia glutinosa]|uniref:Phospholipase/carboxylesterase/thioesterase domain-containing protein n=1 Tax=Rehmannia glutinosa TaxID=99300 RepID=A0ABR0XBL1_REHGL
MKKVHCKELITVVGVNVKLANCVCRCHSLSPHYFYAARRTLDFGRTYVVRPKGKHQATIVWLHGLGDNGNSWSSLLETLPLPNGNSDCLRSFSDTVSGGFDVSDLSENATDDIEGLDVSATYVASLLANEPANRHCCGVPAVIVLIKLGVGGFSMGAAASLYSATCFARGKYENGNQFSVNLSAVVGLSGWLPCARTLSNKLEGIGEAAGRAASLPIMLCHGKGDDVVAYKFGEKSAEKLSSVGFRDVTFKSYSTLGHYTIPEEMDELCAWLTSKLGLEGK